MTKGVMSAAGAPDPIDQHLAEMTEALPAKLADAYARNALQDCATLPIELARATNGYIDATSPFKLKDPAQFPRRDMILHLAARAVSRALAAMLPILPHKAAEGLAQLGVNVEGKTLAELFGELPAGQKFQAGQPLFPQVG
jgi:methionyl-tRNA synthetase